MKTVGLITVGRSDFGLYESLIREVKKSDELILRIMPTGEHCSTHSGSSNADFFESNSLHIEKGLEIIVDSDSPVGVAKSLGLGVLSFAQAFAIHSPDLLVVLGDRQEMVCGPIAAVPFNIPIAHIHGGKVTEGSTDELIRHALTKMSHLHFASCDEYASRIRQMGEEDWRVFTVGALGLDRISNYETWTREELCDNLGLRAERPFLLVTYHPVTLERNSLEQQIDVLISALKEVGLQLVITYPNIDIGRQLIVDKYQQFSVSYSGKVRLLKGAGSEMYINLMRHASAMVGNSSSGIVEAPSFKLPVVNIGTRQDGAMRANNVVDVNCEKDSIKKGIQTCLSNEFNESISNMTNPYGNGNAGKEIVRILESIEINDRLLRKKFISHNRAQV